MEYTLIKKLDESLGEEKHSIVYPLREKDTRNILIVKIYDSSKFNFYDNERNILTRLNDIYGQENNRFFLMYKNIQYHQNLFEIPGRFRNSHLQFLFFDYLPRLSLLDYISEIGEKINENHAKFLCREILKIIEKLHNINILHNAIDVSNIMFDNDFNTKLIHFSQATIINNINEGYKLNQDIFLLGLLLTKILTRGIMKTIVYSEKQQKYGFLFTLPKSVKKEYYGEKKFWEMIKNSGISISEQFKNFFHILIYAKRSTELMNINSLLQNGWLSELDNNVNNSPDFFKNDFAELYNIIMEVQIKTNQININIKNFINEYDDEIYNGDDYEDNVESTNKENINMYYSDNQKVSSKDNLSDNNIINNFNKINLNKDDNYFKPREGCFNYLEINIKNEENYDIKEAINTFMYDLKNGIKTEYEKIGIKVKCNKEKDTLLKISYEIEPLNLVNDNIEFLDKKYEQKIKNKQKFEINVELIEGNKSLIEQKKIHQYYLIFNRVDIDKDDFYDHLKFLKDLIRKILKNE